MAISRGEIYFVNLSPVQGREQAGTRPVLVLSIDGVNQLPLVVTVVVGTKGANLARDYSTNVGVRPWTADYRWTPCSWDFNCVRWALLGSQQRQQVGWPFPYLSMVDDAVRYCLGL